MKTKLIINSIEKLNQHEDAFKNILEKCKTNGVYAMRDDYLINETVFEYCRHYNVTYLSVSMHGSEIKYKTNDGKRVVVDLDELRNSMIYCDYDIVRSCVASLGRVLDICENIDYDIVVIQHTD